MTGVTLRALFHNLPRLSRVLAGCAFFMMPSPSPAQEVFDMGAAREICDSLPLSGIEGVWLYPDDRVTVLIIRNPRLSSTEFTTYKMTVVETSDCNLHPGDRLGTLTESAEAGKYNIELFTERKNGLLLKPRTCRAEISKDGESIIFKKDKNKLNFRLTINPYTLLPGLWKIFRTNVSTSPFNTTSSSSPVPAAGMIKIYPSYDGNMSSRRSPRYL